MSWSSALLVVSKSVFAVIYILLVHTTSTWKVKSIAYRAREIMGWWEERVRHPRGEVIVKTNQNLRGRDKECDGKMFLDLPSTLYEPNLGMYL